MSSIVIAGDTSGTVTLQAPAVSGSNTLSLPAATDTLVGRNTTDTLTNKTISGNLTITGSGAGVIFPDSTQLGTASSLGIRNRIINGNFDVWQRATSSSSTGHQTADRFRYSDNGAGVTITQSQQTFTIGQTDVPYEPTYFYRVAKTVAGSAGTFTAIEQGIEDVRTFAGQTATISFYAKTTSGTVSCSVYLAQYFGSGGSGNVNTSSTSVTLTTTWQKFTATVSVPSISGKTIGTGNCLFFTLSLPNNATFTADISQVQVEAGSVATPFERRPYGMELALCLRYYYSYSSQGREWVWVTYSSNGDTRGRVFHPVPMRSSPTITFSTTTWNAVGFGQSGTGVNVSASSVTAAFIDSYGWGITITGNSGMSSTAYGSVVVWGSNITVTVYASAEL